MDGEFNGGHVAISDPVEAIEIVQEAPLHLLNCSRVVQLFLDHLEPSE